MKICIKLLWDLRKAVLKHSETLAAASCSFEENEREALEGSLKFHNFCFDPVFVWLE